MPRALLPPLSLALALLAGMGHARAQDLIPRPDADPQLVLNEARDLTRAGRYEEALQRQIWFRANATRLNPGMGAVRQSFALSAWVELARKYPPAQQALVETRDRAVAACRGKDGTAQDVSDVASINGYLDEDDRTIALFRELDAEKPKLARSSIFFVVAKLIEAGEYPLCAKYLPNFGSIRQSYEMSLNIKRPNDDGSLIRHMEEYFSHQTCQLIEVLVGAGRKPEAEAIQAQALTVRDDPSIHEAITAAEERIIQRVRPAAASQSPRQKP